MTRFNKLFSCASIFLCATIAALNATAQSTSSFTLKLSTESAEFRAGNDVEVTIIQTNISDHEIVANVSRINGIDSTFDYDVRDEDGNAVAKSTWSKPVPPPVSYHEGAIGPGQSVTEGVYLSNGYNLTRPGRYTIQVSRLDPETKDSDGNPVKVHSNTITITVVAADPAPDAAK